jgi:hypothetical protein
MGNPENILAQISYDLKENISGSHVLRSNSMKDLTATFAELADAISLTGAEELDFSRIGQGQYKKVSDRTFTNGASVLRNIFYEKIMN